MTKKTLKLGELFVGPGEREAGIHQITVHEHQMNIPLFLINGKEDGPTLAVTAGIHGGEYASIEAALQLGRSLQPEELRGQVIVVPVANVLAFRAAVAKVCPLDGKNLNRVFPGSPAGTASERIAHWLMSDVIGQADYYVDLHGGGLTEALVPFIVYHASGNDEVDRVSLEMARVFGIEYIVRTEISGSGYAVAAESGVPTILAEAGERGRWPPELVAVHINGLSRLMRHLGMLDGPTPEPLPSTLMIDEIWMSSGYDGYFYREIEVGAVVEKGQVLGRITDFRGEVLDSVAAPDGGVVLFLLTGLAISKGGALLSIGIEDE